MILNVPERRAYIARKLKSKLKKLPECDFDDYELEEMGPFLRRSVEETKLQRDLLQAKLDFATHENELVGVECAG